MSTTSAGHHDIPRRGSRFRDGGARIVAVDCDTRVFAGYVPGLVGRVTCLHAVYCARNWNFTPFFETRVATEMSGFVNRFDASGDGIWSAVFGGRIEASITIDAIQATDIGAHLRWFIASERIRGQGVGARLLDLAKEFCRRQGYPRIYLDSFEGLETARRLYQRAGYRLVTQQPGEQWGGRVTEQRYEVEQ